MTIADPTHSLLEDPPTPSPDKMPGEPGRPGVPPPAPDTVPIPGPDIVPPPESIPSPVPDSPATVGAAQVPEACQ
jgi:hypothetical protein